MGIAAIQGLLQQVDIKNGCKIVAKWSDTCFVVEKKISAYVCLFAVNMYEFIYFLWNHNSSCSRFVVWGNPNFRRIWVHINILGGQLRCLGKTDLIVHLLSSMSTNKVALNSQTSSITPSNKDPFFGLVAMLYKWEIFCERHNCSPRLFLIERSYNQQTSYKVR